MNKTTQQFFDNYYSEQIPFNSNDVDRVIGHFQKRGFEQTAAINTALVLLRQASVDKLNVNELIDTLKGISDVQLSNVVAQILNANREKTSQLGYKEKTKEISFEQRNIII